MNIVPITLDSRVRIPLALLSQVAIDALKSEFTHDNPDHAREERLAKARGWSRKVDPTIPTWTEENGELTLPRGRFAHIRDLLTVYKYSYEISDRRTEGDPKLRHDGYALLPHINPANFQIEARDKAGEVQNCLLRAPTGCIVGDAVVTTNRAGKGSKMKLSHVVRMFNGGVSANGMRWDPTIPTSIRAPFPDETVRLAKLLSAKCSGVQKVFRLTLETSAENGTKPGRLAPSDIGSGKRDVTARVMTIEATDDHRMLTPNGWFKLKNLVPHDEVMIDGGIQRSKVKRKLNYPCLAAKPHPYVGRKGVKPHKGGWTVPTHRLAAEATLNGMKFEEFVAAVRAATPGLKYLDPKIYAVHHVNENHRDNRPENLQIVTHDEHRRIHKNHAINNISSRLVPARVVSVEYVGKKETFDLEVDGASAFIANEIAVHNSGKTCFAELIIASLGLPTVVLVQTDELFKQWVRRLHTELGVPTNEIGQIKGKVHKVKPITVASVKTFAKHIDKYKRTFGVVIFDEVQRAAANTFYPAVDGLDAKYRIGISADERRKDKKDFLIYDLFGKVALDVDRKRLIADGFILDTEVRLVPTEFEAPWYTKLDNFQKQSEQVFNRLLAQMTKDERRNELAVKLIVEQMKAGHVSLVFSHRVEHCFDLRARIVERDHRVGIVVGEPKYKQESNESLQQIASGKIVAAVGTVQSIGTGIDIPSAARGIATTPMHSNRQQAGQMRGRICRVDRSPNATKTDSILYVLWDRKVHGLVPLRQWLRINDGNVTVYDPETGKTEPGRAFLKRAEREEAETI